MKGDNYGIQVNHGNITAGAMAVGENAVATNTGNVEIRNVLEDLRKAVESLPLSQPQQKLLLDDVAKMQDAGSDKEKIKPLLERFADKLKMAGVVAGETLSLAGPLGKLAAMVGTSLGALV